MCHNAGFVWIWTGPGAPPELPSYAAPPSGFTVHAEIEVEVPVEHGLLMEVSLAGSVVPNLVLAMRPIHSLWHAAALLDPSPVAFSNAVGQLPRATMISNETKRNETKRNETKRNETKPLRAHPCVACLNVQSRWVAAQ